MRMTSLRLTAFCAALLAWLPLQIHAQTAEAIGADVTARVIVKLKSGSPLLARQALAAGGTQPDPMQALGQRLGLATRAGRQLTEPG